MLQNLYVLHLKTCRNRPFRIDGSNVILTKSAACAQKLCGSLRDTSRPRNPGSLPTAPEPYSQQLFGKFICMTDTKSTQTVDSFFGAGIMEDASSLRHHAGCIWREHQGETSEEDVSWIYGGIQKNIRKYMRIQKIHRNLIKYIDNEK